MIDFMTDSNGTVLFSGGDFLITEDVSEFLKQRLYIRLRSHKNDWFLNKNFGVDWFNDDLERGYEKSTLDLIIQNEILKDDLVKELVSFNSEYDSRTCTYTCNFVVKTKTYGLVNSSFVI